MMKYLWLWKALGISGLLGLMLTITVWNGWLTTYQQIPRSIELLILLLPLMLLIRGMFNGRVAANVYAVLLSLCYATLGAWYVAEPIERGYGIALIGFSVLLYLGGFLTARTRGQVHKEKLATEADQLSAEAKEH